MKKHKQIDLAYKVASDYFCTLRSAVSNDIYCNFRSKDTLDPTFDTWLELNESLENIKGLKND